MNSSLQQGALGASPNTGITSLLITISKGKRPEPQEPQEPQGTGQSREETVGQEDQEVFCTAVSSLCVHDASHLWNLCIFIAESVVIQEHFWLSNIGF